MMWNINLESLRENSAKIAMLFEMKKELDDVSSIPKMAFHPFF